MYHIKLVIKHRLLQTVVPTDVVASDKDSGFTFPNTEGSYILSVQRIIICGILCLDSNEALFLKISIQKIHTHHELMCLPVQHDDQKVRKSMTAIMDFVNLLKFYKYFP
jgi:hypothetical protein